jgi:ATP-dependent Zn protease
VKSILIEGQEKARRILIERRTDLDELSEVLLERETLDRADLDRHFSPEGSAELERKTAEL